MIVLVSVNGVNRVQLNPAHKLKNVHIHNTTSQSFPFAFNCCHFRT